MKTAALHQNLESLVRVALDVHGIPVEDVRNGVLSALALVEGRDGIVPVEPCVITSIRDNVSDQQGVDNG